ncbi:SU10 major capsid protein [Noviluteimonas gilva]|uniref:Head protein n=1 Tax=Noviluteimonas gilva TaxID=2682097 RepID=A0A7C9M281_9GAMM|nr:DUF5309 family protein [Lysobacter gilvus]MUV13586.1 head protein [Lysobacter gilvus]
MPTNMLQTYTVIGMKEEVDDKIYRVSPEETPFVSMIGRRSVDSVTPEWLRESLRTPAANAKVEGLDATYAAQTQPERLSNKCQIISDTLSVTGTADRVAKYGRDKETARLKAKKMVELKKDIEWASLDNGAFVAGDASTARQMRGLYGWVATNNELGVAGSPAAPVIATNTAPVAGTLRALTEAVFKSLILKVYNSGGKAEVFMVKPTHKQIVSAFTGNVTRFNDVSSKAVRLQTSFSVYGHDFGETKIVPNRVMGQGTTVTNAGLANTGYLIDPEQIELGVLRPFQSQQLAKVGDAENHLILTECTLIVKEEKALGAYRDITATGA